MRPTQAFTWSLLSAARVTFGQSLESVLLENDFTRFVSLLQGSPVLEFGYDLIIYAPTDASLEGIGEALVARAENSTAGSSSGYNTAYQIANGTAYRPYTGPGSKIPPPKPKTTTTSKTTSATARPRLLARQDVDPEPDCGVVRETWLEDPAFVNLGPGHNQTIIEKNVCGMSRPLIFSGLGASVKVTADDIPFDRGVIRPVTGPFTVPRPLSETLRYLGAGRFLDALDASGLLAEIEPLASITVLATTDAAFKKETDGLSPAELLQVLKRAVLIGSFPPVYTPLVQDGDVYVTLADGSGVVASVVDDVISFGGAEVSAADAVIKNGVVHTVNRVLTANSVIPIAEPSSTITAGPSATPTAEYPSSTSVITAGAAGLPSAWRALGFTLVAGLIAAARYY